jgi:hypothetical protein
MHSEQQYLIYKQWKLEEEFRSFQYWIIRFRSILSPLHIPIVIRLWSSTKTLANQESSREQGVERRLE